MQVMGYSNCDGRKERSANVFARDHDYIKTLGLRIVPAGIFQRYGDNVKEAFIINETAVKEWGFGTPEKRSVSQ
jgi:putative ABC transport system permease protein